MGARFGGGGGGGAGAGGAGAVRGMPTPAVWACATVFDAHAGASSASATINLNTTTRMFQSPTTAVDNERCLIRAPLEDSQKGTGAGRARDARPPSLQEPCRTSRYGYRL